MENFQKHISERPMSVVITDSITNLDQILHREMGADEDGSKPVRRRCTDLGWLLLFLAFWVGTGFVSWVGYQQGDLSRLINPRDSEGNLCGKNEGSDSMRNLSSMPYLMYFDLSYSTTYRRCVSRCPNVTLDPTTLVCKYDVPEPTDSAGRTSALYWGDCSLTQKSTPIYYRCIPDLLVGLSSSLVSSSSSSSTNSSNNATDAWSNTINSDLSNGGTLGQVAAILNQYYWVIILGFFISMTLSFLWTYFLLRSASFMTYSVVWVSLALFALVCGLASYGYHSLSVSKRNILVTGLVIDSSLKDQQTLLIIAIVSGILFVGLAVIFYGVWGRIPMAVKMIREASRTLQKIPAVILFPLLKWFFLLIVIGFTAYFYTLWTSVGTYSSGIVSYTVSNGTTVSTRGTNFSQPINVYVCQAYLAFGFVWTYYWILAVEETTVAMTVAQFYWTPERMVRARMPLVKSLYRVLRYHLGSLAFGSVIISFMDFLRTVVELVQSKLFDMNVNTINKTGCLTRCCCRCVEKLLTSISKIAYVYVAMYGYSFCRAGHASFALLAKHTTKLIVVDRVSSFLLFLGEIVIVVVTCLLCLLSMYLEMRINSPAARYEFFTFSIPIFFVALLSLMVSMGFMTIYWMAIETIFLCFCEDCERHDGSPEHPYVMSKSLECMIEAEELEAKEEKMAMIYDKQKTVFLYVKDPESGRQEAMSLYEFNKTRSSVISSQHSQSSLEASGEGKASPLVMGAPSSLKSSPLSRHASVVPRGQYIPEEKEEPDGSGQAAAVSTTSRGEGGAHMSRKPVLRVQQSTSMLQTPGPGRPPVESGAGGSSISKGGDRPRPVSAMLDGTSARPAQHTRSILGRRASQQLPGRGGSSSFVLREEAASHARSQSLPVPATQSAAVGGGDGSAQAVMADKDVVGYVERNGIIYRVLQQPLPPSEEQSGPAMVAGAPPCIPYTSAPRGSMGQMAEQAAGLGSPRTSRSRPASVLLSPGPGGAQARAPSSGLSGALEPAPPYQESDARR